jgi:mediator of RNA polymerase II transcription subunit 5
MSQISNGQAMLSLALASDILQNFRLSPDLRQVLENFTLSLSLVIGDDTKAVREAQMIHTMQFALGKTDMLGSNSNSEIVTFGLAFHQLVSRYLRKNLPYMTTLP